MTTADATSIPLGERWSATASTLAALAPAGMASIGAGAIHAAAIGVHSEHRQAVIVFALLAAFQVGWGALGLTRDARWVAFAGAIGNGAALLGWVMAKTSGIGFVDGLDQVERVQLPDAAAALLAAVAVAAAITLLIARYRPPRLVHLGAVLAVTALAVPSMVATGSHRHAEGEAGHDHGTETVAAGSTSPTASTSAAGHAHGATPAAATKPYDPTQPIDLSGVAGVTPEQQARAENLIAVTLLRLPRFADPLTAEAAGYKSIQDGITGFEHYINWSYIDDDKVLDPDFPESLVYRVYRDGRPRELQAAMFMLHSTDTLDTVPDLGGALTQWHIHDNLCFTNEPGNWKVRGVTAADGTCAPPLVANPIQAPMIHVWIVKQRCGPFAALEGVGGGQIKAGETRLCDHAHGA
jgi:hypothetical protein